ncbi:hypothetical protein GCM10009613_52830 [Pseudonocardia kongjuensis]|uniref:Segregation and condensation protein B n=1 Tax=Pseudonocardia kongjuensis TaxID=102227 RepID=A0ABN1Y5H1_9PSEU
MAEPDDRPGSDDPEDPSELMRLIGRTVPRSPHAGTERTTAGPDENRIDVRDDDEPARTRAPGTEPAPATDRPSDDPAAGDPASDDPVADDAVADDAVADEAAADDPAADDSAADDLVVDDLTFDDTASDEPAADDLAADDSAADDSAADDLAADDLAADDPAVDETAADDPAADESAADESAADESAADDLAVDDPALTELTDDTELEKALEALLLVVDTPVDEESLATTLGQTPVRIRQTLDRMSFSYTADARGIDLRRVGGGWRFYTRDRYAPYVEKLLLDGQRARLTRAALETLAVVAYRQPVTRARVAAVRGVNCDGVLRTLLTRGLVEEAGTEEHTGGTLFRTTEVFLERLGLSSVQELPPLAPLLPDIDAIDDLES